MNQISNREARWLAIRAQGLAAQRPLAGSRPGRRHLRQVMGRVGTIQLDAVNVLARTQFLVPWSRLGAYDTATLRSLSGPGKSWWEYWGHAASLLPVEIYPLFRHRMEHFRQDQVGGAAGRERRRAWRAAHAGYMDKVLAEVAERGPIAASELSDPRPQTGEWWDRRSTGRRALEMLFGDGVLAAWRSPNFERIYDLAERVLPASVLALPTPPQPDAQRELVALAAASMGVATAADLADYFWLGPDVARARASELAEEGRLSEVAVEGWRRPAYMVPTLRPKAPRREEATLLSPFDSLIWRRDRTWRLFAFHYRIEIYVPATRRAHGYYVMPLLLGDELVARLDLKADRKESTLRVSGAYAEPGWAEPATATAAVAELGRLREWLGLEALAVAAKGDLARLLGKALRPG
jgi:uncharacterized protein